MAGRKPKPEDAKKSAMFSARISSDLRARMEAESAQTGKSMARILEDRMAASYREPKRIENWLGKEHVQALAVLVAHVVKSMETTTGRKWHEDPFTCDAVRSAIRMIVQHLRPEGEASVPDRIKERVAMSPEAAEFFGRPEGQAAMVVNGIIDKLEILTDTPPPGNDRFYAEGFFSIPWISRKLRRK